MLEISQLLILVAQLFSNYQPLVLIVEEFYNIHVVLLDGFSSEANAMPQADCVYNNAYVGSGVL